MEQNLDEKQIEEMLEALPKWREEALARTLNRKNARLRTLEFEMKMPIRTPTQEDELKAEVAAVEAEIKMIEAEPNTEGFMATMPNKGEARIFGMVERGGRSADRIALFVPEKSDQPIAQSDFDNAGNYALTTACLEETGELRIFDGKTEILTDNRPLELGKYAVYERNYTLRACSLGGVEEPKVLMPDVTGLSIEEARKILSQFEVAGIDVKEKGADEPAGTVLAQSPFAGEVLSPKTQVTVHISRSTKHFMPNVLGQSPENAKGMLKGLPFANIQFDQVAGKGKAGTIIKQSPNEGAELNDATAVLLCVLSDTDEDIRIVMPALHDMNLKAALKILQETGLTNVEVKGLADDGNSANFVITRVSPKAGTKIKPSRLIRLVVSG